MKITVIRGIKQDKYTIGKLYIDGVYFCDTMEDKDRGLTQNTPLSKIKEIKVPKETAIPSGTYKVTLDVVSPKYSVRSAYQFCGGKVPRLLNVPGYEGILIHIGNYYTDTEGCILVGKSNGMAVTGSTDIFKKLYEILLQDKNNITIEIK
jgi:hypothetical protein